MPSQVDRHETRIDIHSDSLTAVRSMSLIRRRAEFEETCTCPQQSNALATVCRYCGGRFHTALVREIRCQTTWPLSDHVHQCENVTKLKRFFRHTVSYLRAPRASYMVPCLQRIHQFKGVCLGMNHATVFRSAHENQCQTASYRGNTGANRRARMYPSMEPFSPTPFVAHRNGVAQAIQDTSTVWWHGTTNPCSSTKRQRLKYVGIVGRDAPMGSRDNSGPSKVKKNILSTRTPYPCRH